MENIINPYINFPADTSAEIITEKIKIFFQENEEEIINFYKAWIICLGGPYLGDINVRHIPGQFNIGFGRFGSDSNEKFVLMLFVEYSTKFLIPSGLEEFTISTEEKNMKLDPNSRKIFFGKVNSKFLFGRCIAIFEKEEFKINLVNNDQAFHCDSCGQSVNIGGSLCEVCNFDTCEECSKTIVHDHQTFRYPGFYEILWIDSENVLINLKYDIKNKCFV